MTTYNDLLDLLPPSLEIPSLGGRTFVTILNHGPRGLMVVNSKGNVYPLSRQDWTGTNEIRKSEASNPWKTSHYTGFSMWTSYSLVHAAALLRHIEEQESVAMI